MGSLTLKEYTEFAKMWEKNDRQPEQQIGGRDEQRGLGDMP